MAGVNKVILIGNLGGDPEIRQIKDGKTVANFSMATSESWTRDGSTITVTEWHKVVAWGKLAEICGEYLVKGKQVYIEGKIQTRKWEDKEGVTRYTTEIVAFQMQMLGRKDEGYSAGADGGGGVEPSDESPPELDDIPF